MFMLDVIDSVMLGTLKRKLNARLDRRLKRRLKRRLGWKTLNKRLE